MFFSHSDTPLWPTSWETQKNVLPRKAGPVKTLKVFRLEGSGSLLGKKVFGIPDKRKQAESHRFPAFQRVCLLRPVCEVGRCKVLSFGAWKCSRAPPVEFLHE